MKENDENIMARSQQDFARIGRQVFARIDSELMAGLDVEEIARQERRRATDLIGIDAKDVFNKWPANRIVNGRAVEVHSKGEKKGLALTDDSNGDGSVYQPQMHTQTRCWKRHVGQDGVNGMPGQTSGSRKVLNSHQDDHRGDESSSRQGHHYHTHKYTHSHHHSHKLSYHHTVQQKWVK